MIDTATIERYMRDANPIPHINDVDSDEFARFVAAAKTRRAAVMQAPTQYEASTTSTTTPPLLRRRRVWAFAAAFILILASIGIAALALRNNNPPVTNEPAETPEQPISVESLTWSRVPLEGDGLLWGLGDMTAGGPGLVAVGRAPLRDDSTGLIRDRDGFPTVWTSPDGYTWTQVPHDETVFPLDSEIKSVTAGGPGLVAVGGRDVWTSPDGYTWSRVPRDPSVVDPITGDLSGVIAGGPGLVAFGESGPQGHTAVWTSPDGYTWTQVPHDETVFPLDSGITSVTEGGPGLIAVGFNQTDRDGQPALTFPVVWTSPDGYTWTRVPHDPAVFSEGTGMVDIAVGDPGLVAVGFETRDGWPVAAVVWTSPDGLSWTRIPYDEATLSGDMWSVAAFGDGFVVVGGELRAWTSPDGTTWTPIPDAAAVFGENTSQEKVIAGGPGVVISGGMEGDLSAMWVATPTGTDKSSPPPTPADFSVGWQPVAVDETWVESIADIDALPDGGFLVTATSPWSLMWSPDGTEWFDADPQHQIADPANLGEHGCRPFCLVDGERGQPVAMAADHALILNQAPPGVWVGDPREGTWELVPLDTGGLDHPPRLEGIASSGSDALVVASTSSDDLQTWLVNITSRTSQRHPIAAASAEKRDWPLGNDSTRVAWFNGRWLVAPDCQPCSIVYLSTDGSNWTESEIRWTADADPVPEWNEFRPGDGWGNGGLIDSAGAPDAIIAAYFGLPHAYSQDGVTWFALPAIYETSSDTPNEWWVVTYSDELGFVTASLFGDRFMQLGDEPSWRTAGQWPDETGVAHPTAPAHHLTASGNRMLLVREDDETEVEGLWLWDSN